MTVTKAEIIIRAEHGIIVMDCVKRIENGQIIIDCGTPTVWFAIPPQVARQIAKTLNTFADELEPLNQGAP